MNKNTIECTPKHQYKKFINIKAKEAAFKIYLKLPETLKKKVRGLE